MPGTGGPSLSRVAAPPPRASLPGRALRLTQRLPSQRPRLCVLVWHFLQLGVFCTSPGCCWGTGGSQPHSPFLCAPLGACSFINRFSLHLCLILCASLSDDSFLDVVVSLVGSSGWDGHGGGGGQCGKMQRHFIKAGEERLECFSSVAHLQPL